MHLNALNGGNRCRTSDVRTGTRAIVTDTVEATNSARRALGCIAVGRARPLCAVAVLCNIATVHSLAAKQLLRRCHRDARVRATGADPWRTLRTGSQLACAAIAAWVADATVRAATITHFVIFDDTVATNILLPHRCGLV